jgi:hypothetical protein
MERNDDITADVVMNSSEDQVPDALEMYDGHSEPLTDLNLQYGEQP